MILFRPRILRYGGTEKEAWVELAGDDLIGNPKYQTTRAISISAPIEAVCPWIVQIGQGRAGFYSYDWIENLAGLSIHSSKRIVPEFQNLSSGDIVEFAPCWNHRFHS